MTFLETLINAGFLGGRFSDALKCKKHWKIQSYLHFLLLTEFDFWASILRFAENRELILTQSW